MQSLEQRKAGENLMQVIRAESLGRCFGVQGALRRAREIAHSGRAAVHGDLVRDEAVRAELDELGFLPLRTPPPANVMIPPRGISWRERGRLEAQRTHLIDATCPAAFHAQRAARRLEELNYFVVVVGRRGQGGAGVLTDDLTRYEIVERADEVRDYGEPRIGIVCQTTMPARVADEVHARVRELNAGAEIHFTDTTCQPMRERFDALEALLDRVEALVIVDDADPSADSPMVARAHERGVPVVQVRRPDQLDPDWFDGMRVVGLTASTSTPAEAVDAIHSALLAFAELPAPSR